MTSGSGANRILVIDSDRGAAAMLRTLLEGRGYIVRVAFDGLSGVAAIQADTYSLFIVGTALQGVSGEEIVTRLDANERTHGIPVIVVAPANDYQQRVRMFELGVDDYLVKPLSALDVLTRVQALLRRAAAPAAAPQKGEVIVFVGCAGGVGTTTICINIAQALSARAPTVVVDAGWPIGAVGVTLGAPQEDGLQQMAVAGSVPSDLEPYYAGGRGGIRFRYLNGYDSLAAPTDVDVDVPALLEQLRTDARYVLVDAGTAGSPFAARLLSEADVVVLVMAFERTHLTIMRAYVEYLDRLGVRQNRRLIVGSRIRPSPLGLRDMDRHFGSPLATVIPYEGERLARCLNDGVILITQFPDCAGAIAMAELATTLTRQTAVEA